MLIGTFVLKVINKEKKKIFFNPSWNHWSHCRKNWVRDHSSVQRIKNRGFIRLYSGQVSHLLILLSSPALLYCRYIYFEKGILLRKIRNLSKALKLQENIKNS